MQGTFCIYLRKSRADMEAEQRGEGETLARHKKALLHLADIQGIPVSTLYQEIVSGDTIASRPVMRKLVEEVEQGVWRGVLVMEVERLARGDTIDQGIVARAFHHSGTLIITPIKTYNPASEFDQEYFEFGLFMSRREYKTINRRLQGGRLASVMEGKYIASQAPYGYRKTKLEGDKGFSLLVWPEEAAVVRLIFHLFVQGGPSQGNAAQPMGITRIAGELNQMGLSTRSGGPWTASSVRDILTNPVYAGKVRWNYRKSALSLTGGQPHVTRPRQQREQFIVTPGHHAAIIGEDLWQRAQSTMEGRANASLPASRSLKNPLAGLVVCAHCGHRLQRKPGAGNLLQPTLACATPGCPNVSCQLDMVETRLVQALGNFLAEFPFLFLLDNAAENPGPQPTREALMQHLARLHKQRDRLCELLEQGAYDVHIFQARKAALDERLEKIQAALEQLPHASAPLCAPAGNDMPKDFSTLYRSMDTPLSKNRLLKLFLQKAVYQKKPEDRWRRAPDTFRLTIYPSIGIASPD